MTATDRDATNASKEAEGLTAITILTALDCDERPSFVIRDSDAAPAKHGKPLHLIYHNPALLAVDGLFSQVSGQVDAKSVFAQSSTAQLGFRAWLHGKVTRGDRQRRGNAYVFESHVWSIIRIQSHKIVSGIKVLSMWTDAVPGQHTAQQSTEQTEAREFSTPGTAVRLEPMLLSNDDKSTTISSIQKKSFDYTREILPPFVAADPHITYFRSVDWSATSLGPMQSWSDELRTIVNATLNSAYPATLWFGNNVELIYNQEYIQLIGSLHPCMGKSIRDLVPHHFPVFEPCLAYINKTGRSVFEGSMPLFIARHGASEETHWSWQLVPILDKNGLIIAYYHTLNESTDHYLLMRRVSSLVEVASQTTNARDFESFWEITLHTLTLNDRDVPFALLYTAESNQTADISSISAPGSLHTLERFHCKGSIGVDIGHVVAPSVIDLGDETYIFHQSLLQALKSRNATTVNLSDLPNADIILEGIDWKGYGDPCNILLLCPVLPTNGDQVEGFLILGTNPRRPFDEDYQQYIQVMMRLFATSLASVALFDEEIRRRELAMGQAIQIQEQLLAQLQLKEKKFQRFVERSEVAIFTCDPMGKYTYRNKRWFDIFQNAVNFDDARDAWTAIAFPESLAFCEKVFTRLTVGCEDVTFELKTRIPWTPPQDATQTEEDVTEHYRWILCSAYAELDADGNIIEIVGNVTDISQQKWSEGLQKLRTDSAIKSKQHLEHFIDTTSHEMRNPLSCILQCADGILCSDDPASAQTPSLASWSNFMEQTLNAAHIIVQCAQHMRHIVDDILTISKLNAGLLMITPVDSQPEEIAKHAMKMFEAEAKAAKVDLSFEVEQSYRDMQVDWVSLDPTRLLQILINLLTNAIKFTRLEPVRRVVILLSASRSEPTTRRDGIQFNEDRLVAEHQTLQDDWKQDSNLFFIQFSVKDTGRGLSEQERGNLFTRFSQASPKTHIHYGGSGLGLFISRRLTELQGGAIGLESEPKKGSTFSFYIKTRRTTPTVTRKSSFPTAFPEDVRHRPDMGLVSRCQPPPRSRTPAREDAQAADPAVFRPQRPTALERKISATHAQLPSKLAGLPAADMTELKNEKGILDTLHVLIVEDNLVNQRVLAKQLRNLGCVVRVANHGQEALDLLPETTCWNHNVHPSGTNTRRFRGPSIHIPSTEPIAGLDELDHEPPLIELSLILMDWEMPIMNGLTAVAKIRELERAGVMRGHVPVIGVTANVREQQIQTALAAGMDDVVGKPFRVAELLVRMRGIVGEWSEGGGEEQRGRR